MRKEKVSTTYCAEVARRPGLANGCRVIWPLGLVLVVVVCLSTTLAAAPKLPPPQGLVSDLAEKLSPGARQILEARLQDFKRQSDGIELAVVTMPYEAMGGLPIEKYSLQLARAWGIGAKGKRKDGLLLLIAIQPADEQGIYHGSTRLEVSRSLERELPNSVASGLIGLMHDDFVAGRFDQAANAGVQAIIETLARERGFRVPAASPSPTPTPRMRYGSLPRDEGVGGIVGAVLGVLGGGGAIGFLLLIVLLAAARNRRTWGGGNSRWSNYPPNHPYWNNNQQGTVPEGFQQSSVLSGTSGATQDPVDSGGSM